MGFVLRAVVVVPIFVGYVSEWVPGEVWVVGWGCFWVVGLDCMWVGVGTSRVRVLPELLFLIGGGCEWVIVGLPESINVKGHLGLMRLMGKYKFRAQ